MKKMIINSLSAAIILMSAGTVHSQGIPVIDLQTLGQSTISAMEDVAQTLQQIEQYQTQLDQYQNQLLNSTPLSAAQWADAQRIMSAMNSIVNSSSNLLSFGNDLENYLGNFQTPDYYLQNAQNCYMAQGCTTYNDRNRDQMNANNASFKTIDAQQRELQNDALRLQQLQAQAMGAQGQMQAIQTTNQLAAAQTAQLMQMRAAMLTQQKMLTTYLANQQDEDARSMSHFQESVDVKLMNNGTAVGY